MHPHDFGFCFWTIFFHRLQAETPIQPFFFKILIWHTRLLINFYLLLKIKTIDIDLSKTSSILKVSPALVYAESSGLCRYQFSGFVWRRGSANALEYYQTLISFVWAENVVQTFLSGFHEFLRTFIWHTMAGSFCSFLFIWWFCRKYFFSELSEVSLCHQQQLGE